MTVYTLVAIFITYSFTSSGQVRVKTEVYQSQDSCAKAYERVLDVDKAQSAACTKSEVLE